VARYRRWVGALVALALSARAAAPAAPMNALAGNDTLKFDAAQSSAEFSIRVMWLIPIHGHFAGMHGTIVIDHFRGTARVDALIESADVHMRSRGDEAWVKSAEFFDAQHFPQIQFVSDAFALARLSKGGMVSGKLTIRGKTQTAQFEIDPTECAGAIGIDCPVEAAGTIRRSDFGMRSHRGALSDKVDLDFSIRVLSAAQPPP
jgi:polyisoprenoid-binding protein YceI